MLLAAGAGTRYGSPKALAHDGSWLRGAVTALRAGGCDQVVVVLGAAAEQARALVPEGVEVVVAADWQSGMAASLRAGLRAARERDAGAALVQLVDTPDVGADVVARVLGVAAGSLDTALARASFHGAPRHPVLFGRHHLGAVIDTATGDAGARDFLRGRPDVVLVECGDLATGADHDTPEPA